MHPDLAAVLVPLPKTYNLQVRKRANPPSQVVRGRLKEESLVITLGKVKFCGNGIDTLPFPPPCLCLQFDFFTQNTL